MGKLKIGLFGFGVVGEGIYKVLNQKPQVNAEVLRVVIKDESKPRNAPSSLFSTDKNAILENGDIDVVVELIDDADAAYDICKNALLKGKAVVTANKKMVANHLHELVELQNEYGGSILYEAAVCGSIPIIRNLEEYFDNDLLESVTGIVNGSTNYILTNMSETGAPYEKVLLEAQKLGFAESDPSLDVSGLDAAYKLSIILYHAYGNTIDPQQIPRKGIENVHPFDLKYAREKNSSIKLVASSYWTEEGQLVAHVIPQFVANTSQLYHVKNEFNAVLIGSGLADEQVLYGKGAGRFPTSSAVLSDLSALRYNYKYSFRKADQSENSTLSDEIELRVYVSYPAKDFFDTGVFREIHEQYVSHDRQYVIGSIKMKDLKSSAFWSNNETSIILC